MACAAECFLEPLLRASQHIAAGAHGATYQHRLACKVHAARTCMSPAADSSQPLSAPKEGHTCTHTMLLDNAAVLPAVPTVKGAK